MRSAWRKPGKYGGGGGGGGKRDKKKKKQHEVGVFFFFFFFFFLSCFAPLNYISSISLVQLGFGMWLAHYCFHFLTGLYTLIPVTQNAIASLGRPFLGEPRWTLTGVPSNIVQVVEIGRSEERR